MADMIYYTYSDTIKALFDGKTLRQGVLDSLLALNGTCEAFLSGFDASDADNWLTLLSKPKLVEQTYLIDNPQSSKWQKAYLKDQKRLKGEYEKMIKEVDAGSGRLSPLARRLEIEKRLGKNKALREFVSNPISESEIPNAYSKYMEGQTIQLNKTQASQDLEALQDSVLALRTNIAICKSKLVGMNLDLAFGGLLSKEVSNKMDHLKAYTEVLKSEWESVMLTLVSGGGLSQQNAQRLVRKWVGKLRGLRGDCLALIGVIRKAAPNLILSDNKMRSYILSHSRASTESMIHREFFAWAGLEYKDSGLNILADAYAAKGFESKDWADDYQYKTENNKNFLTRGDKLDLPSWFNHLGMSYSWTSSIDVQDFILTELDGGRPNSALGDIAFDYIKAPTNRKHTLES